MAGRSTINGQTSTVAETVEAMDCEELADMLKQVIKDRKYQEDLQKLIVENINGELFLELPDDADLLNDLRLSSGGKAYIKRIVKKIKDGNFELPQAGGRKPLEPDMAWCTTATPTDTSTNSGNARTTAGDGMQSAWIPADAVWPWKECKEIYVEFRNVQYLINWTIDNGQPMNTHTILLYANTWNRMGEGKIPLFVEAKNGQQAHLRVSFNNNKIRNSQLGKRAQNVKLAEPTMNLDLHNGCPDDEYKKHVIIHEFGHALGLGHEHQRSIFWACIKPFTNIKKMKHDLKVTDEQFDIDWKEVDTTEVGPHSLEYDPDSIMHYWFKVEWLINDYSDEQKVKRDCELGILSEKVAKALLGVHKRRQVLAKEPSTDDIELLKKVYGGPSQTAVPSGTVLEQEYGDDAITNGSRAPAGGRRTAPDSGDIIEIESKESAAIEMPTNGRKQAAPVKPSAVPVKPSEVVDEEDYDLDVTNHYLSRMEYVENGTEKVVSIYDDSAHMWHQIGENLGIGSGVLTSIKRDGDDDRDRVVKVLGKWYENANGLPHRDKYPMTWKGLIKLLKDSNLDGLAGKVRKALTQQKRSGRAAVGPPSSMQPPSNSGKYLSIKELGIVNNAVRDARAQWYFIGLDLGIMAGDLDDIKIKHRDDPAACLTDVLTKFLKQVDPKPSWKRLADAMASPAVGHGDIGEQLRGKI